MLREEVERLESEAQDWEGVRSVEAPGWPAALEIDGQAWARGGYTGATVAMVETEPLPRHCQQCRM